MGALLLLMALLERQSEEQARFLREEQRHAAEQSARNFRIGLENGRNAVEKLAALLRFKDVASKLALPEEVTGSLAVLFGHLEDYVADLMCSCSTRDKVSLFHTEEGLRRSAYRPQFFQPGSAGEGFHRGATQYLDDDCQRVAKALETRFASAAPSDDEVTFIYQFKEFVDALSTAMKELR